MLRCWCEPLHNSWKLRRAHVTGSPYQIFMSEHRSAFAMNPAIWTFPKCGRFALCHGRFTDLQGDSPLQRLTTGQHDQPRMCCHAAGQRPGLADHLSAGPGRGQSRFMSREGRLRPRRPGWVPPRPLQSQGRIRRSKKPGAGVADTAYDEHPGADIGNHNADRGRRSTPDHTSDGGVSAPSCLQTNCPNERETVALVKRETRSRALAPRQLALPRWSAPTPTATLHLERLRDPSPAALENAVSARRPPARVADPVSPGATVSLTGPWRPCL